MELYFSKRTISIIEGNAVKTQIEFKDIENKHDVYGDKDCMKKC